MQFITLTASGIAHAGKCSCGGFLLGMDKVNDMEVTLYDNASAASGNKIVPTNTYDASALGLNGFSPKENIECSNGIYVEMDEGDGAGEVTVYFSVGFHH